jgi:hypothetical protein
MSEIRLSSHLLGTKGRKEPDSENEANMMEGMQKSPTAPRNQAKPLLNSLLRLAFIISGSHSY